ncbi:hypothetical protein [Maribellus mangrovi]|uniref:hypothetical protein n=1 Tax=Maribellus mangrovi TaxID=3133146 RepID=UPI0030EF96D5
MKSLIVFLFVLLISTMSFAQVADTTQVQEEMQKPKLDRSKMYYGGYVTLNFSRDYSVIGAQPMVAYKLTPKLSTGVQATYEYINYKNNSDYSGSNYGASVFSRYRVTPRLYAHAEFQLMSYKWLYSDGDTRKTAPMLYLGGGYSQPITRNTWLTAQVLFDVLNHENSPYKDWEPYFSVGVGVGF